MRSDLFGIGGLPGFRVSLQSSRRVRATDEEISLIEECEGMGTWYYGDDEEYDEDDEEIEEEIE